MSIWTDELKSEVIKKYTSQNPTPDTTAEIIKNISDEYSDLTPNSIRMVLIRSGEYVKVTPSSSSSKTSGSSGGTRVSKAAAQQSLADAISALGHQPDMSIIEKLTGKAAAYLATVVSPADTD